MKLSTKWLFVLTLMAFVGCDDASEEVDSNGDNSGGSSYTDYSKQISAMNNYAEAIQSLAGEINISAYSTLATLHYVTLEGGVQLELTTSGSDTTFGDILSLNADSKWVFSADEGVTFEVVTIGGEAIYSTQKPIFKDEGNIYYVSVDGENYEKLLGRDIAVEAVATTSIYKFKTIYNNPDTGNIEFGLLGGLKTYNHFKEVFEFGLTDEVDQPIEFNLGQTLKYSLTSTGVASVAVTTCPEGWTVNASATELTITAPSSFSYYDSETHEIEVTATSNNNVEETLSINVAFVQIAIVDYYEEGYTTPDGATYSKDTSDAQLITADTEITANGVYFVEPEVTVSITTAKSSFTNLVIIGRHSHSKANVDCNSRIYFATGEGVVWKNVNVITKYSNYLVDAAAEGDVVNRWVIEDCYVETYTGRALTAFYDKKYFAIKNISMKNNIFKCPVAAEKDAIRIVNFNTTLNSDLSLYESFTFVNNIVYTPTLFAGGSVLMMNDTTTDISALDYEIIVSNNTFVNFTGSPDTALLVLQNGNITVDNNLMWASDNISYHSTMFLFKNSTIPSTGPMSITYDGNVFYGLNINTHNWQIYHPTNSKYGYVGGENLFDRLSSDPLTICDLENGIFIKDAAYDSKGATIKW